MCFKHYFFTDPLNIYAVVDMALTAPTAASKRAMSSHAWTALIPLRAGSKGLPGKNVRHLAGKPLYQYAIDAAHLAGAQCCYVTTDIAEVLSAKFTAPVALIQRPSHLQGDEVPMASVLIHAIEQSGITGTVVLLQATSPMRTAQHIQSALTEFATGAHHLVMSVTSADSSVLKWGFLSDGTFKPLADPAFCFSNRQQLPQVYRPNGAIYVFDAQWFVRNQGFITDKIGAFQMNGSDSLDIDTLEDFERCERALLIPK
jgi:CMP-N-acetylneuraminic acid synthetase